MANERKIDYEIQFRANQQSLQNVSKTFQNMLKDIDSYSKLQIINNSTKAQAIKDLNEITKQATIVEEALTGAFNPKLGITNIETFKQNLKSAGSSIDAVRQAFDRAGGAGVEAFQSMANSLTNVRLKATESESILDRMGQSFKRVLTYNISSTILNKMTGSIQEAYGYVKHLDTSLNDIRIVTEYSAEAMDKFAEKANKAAVSLGKSTTDYTEAALIYYQQGLGAEDVEARTNVTLKTANVTQQSTAQVSEQLTAIWNGYKVNAEEAEAYIDKVAKVAATTAADLEEMATGMSKVASAANVMGVDIDQMNAILATTISVTRQAPETIGAAYKTIFARMSTIQAGEEAEDGATLTSYTEKMAALGVSALDANGKLRDMGDIINEVGAKWQNWSREQQIAFAQVAAGTRQYNNLIALFDNWDMYTKSLEESRNAMGTLQTQQDIYMESTAAHLQQLRTAAEGVYDSLLKSEDINSVVDVFTKWTKGIETVVDGLGGLKGILLVIGPLIMNAFSSNLGQMFSQGFSNFTIKEENTIKIQHLKQAIEDLKNIAPETSQRYLVLKDSLAQVANGIKPEIFNKLSYSIEKAASISGQLEKVNSDLRVKSEELKKANEEEAKSFDEIKRKAEEVVAVEKQIEQEKAKIKDTNILEAQKNQVQNVYGIIQSSSQGTKKNGQAIPSSMSQMIQQANYELAQNSSGLSLGDTSNLKTKQDILNRILEIYRQLGDEINNQSAVQDNIDLLEEERKRLLEEEKALEEENGNITERRQQTEKEVNAIVEKRKELIDQLNKQQSALIELEKEAVRYIGEGIGQFSAGIMSTVSAINQVQNVIKIVNDDELSTLEKFKQSLSAIAGATSSAIMGISSFINAFKSFNSAGTSINNIQKQYNDILITQNALIAENTRLQIANNAAKAGGTNAQAGNTGGLVANTGANIANTGSVVGNTGANVANTASIVANKIARLGLIAIIGAATIAFVAYMAYVASGAKKEKDLTKETEKATKAYQKQKEVLSEIKEKHDNLNNLTETYKEQKKALDDLVAGTEEWNKQMESLSETVDKLVDEYPELIQYATYNPSTGHYTIDESQLEAFQKKKQEELNNQQIAADRAALVEAQAQVKELEYKQQKYGSYLDELNKWQDIEIGLRKKLANELMSEADKKKAEGDYDAYQVALYNTQKKENLGNVTREDAIYNALIKQKYDEDRANPYVKESSAEILEKATQFIHQNYDFTTDAEGNKVVEYTIKSIEDGSERTITKNYDDFIEEFIKSDEEKEKLYEDYFKEATSATAKVLQDNLNSGLTSLEDLTLDQLKTLVDNNAIVKGQQITSDTIKSFHQARKDKYFTNNAERNAYSRLVENGGLIGVGNAIPEELDLIAQKITEAYKEGSIEGVEEFEKEWKNKPLKRLLEFEIPQKELDMIQAKLAEAGISEEDFIEIKIGLFGEDNKDYDQEVANYLLAEEKINQVYQDREKIFKNLEKYDPAKKAHRDQMNQVQDALSAAFGQDVSEDFVKKNLSNIETFFNADSTKKIEERKAALQELINVYNESSNAQLKIIEDNFREFEGQFNQGDKIKDTFISSQTALLKELGASDEQIKEEFEKHGYIWDEESGAYYYKVKFDILTGDKLSSKYQEWKEVPALRAFYSSFEEYMEAEGYEKQEDDTWKKTIKIKLGLELSSMSQDQAFATTQYVQAAKAAGIDSHKIIEHIREMLGDNYATIDDATIAGYYGLEINVSGEIGQVDIKSDKVKEAFAGLTTEINNFNASKYNLTTTTYEQVEKTPTLDTTSFDNQLKTLKQDISDYQNELKKLIPDTEAYANAQQKLVQANSEYIKTARDKIEATKAFTAANKDAAASAVEAATGIKVLFNEDGTVSNWTDINNAVADATGYNAKAAAYEKAQNAYHSMITDETGTRLSDEQIAEKVENGTLDIDKLEAAKEAAERAGKEAKLAKSKYDDATKSIQSAIKYLQEYDKQAQSLTEQEKELIKIIETTWDTIGDTFVNAAQMAGEAKEKYENLEYSLKKTKKALSELGDANNYSGSGLISYYTAYADTLETINTDLKEQQDLLKQNNQLRESKANELLELAQNGDGKDLKGSDALKNFSLDKNKYQREDGSWDIVKLQNDLEQLAQSVSKEEAAIIRQYSTDLAADLTEVNNNIDLIESLSDEFKDNLLEAAKATKSLTFVQVNKDLDDLNNKLNIANEKLEDTKALFDKSSSFGSIDAFKEWKNEYENYLQYLDEVGNKHKEKLEKIFSQDEVKDLLTDEEGESIFNLFNAKSREEFIDGYYKYVESIEEAKVKIEQKISNLQAELTDPKSEKTEEEKTKLQEEIQALQIILEQLGDSYEWAAQKKKEYINQKLDVSEVEKLSKEWKTASIDREIKKVSRELSLLQKQQSRLKGKDIITNLQQQIEVIKKQIALEQKKMNIMKSQLNVQKTLIMMQISAMKLSNLGSAFDSSGHVSGAFLDKLAKSANITNEELQMLINSLKEYESIMSQIESQEDAILSLQDEIADKSYEIAEKEYENFRELMEKELNKFKIEIEVALNEADLMRQIDRLRAKVAGITDRDLAKQMSLDISDAVSYATKDITILTDAVNKLLGDYSSGAWKDFYDTQKDAYDDIQSYASKLISAVQAFYDALDSAREKYSQAIDEVINANQQIIADYEHIKKIAKHGINITKMLFGENSYEQLSTYYDKIEAATREQIAESKRMAEYYKALLSTIDPMTHPDEYKAVKEAYKSAMDDVYNYGEQLMDAALERFNAKLDAAGRKFQDTMAKSTGLYDNTTMMDLAHDQQQYILKGFLDEYESQYEIVTLQNKFTDAINQTSDAAQKSKLTKVMQEQVKYLNDQIAKEGRLTKYQVDRANLMYELTLKQMALEETRDNKTKMRLRRDSQGNYRYEYIADEENTLKATQDVLDTQYQLYELDKQRLLDLQQEKLRLWQEYEEKLKKILEDENLTEKQKQDAAEELHRQYVGRLEDIYAQHSEVVKNIEESSGGVVDEVLRQVIEETSSTAGETAGTLDIVKQGVTDLYEEGLESLASYTDTVEDALDLITGGTGDLEGAINSDIEATLELIDTDEMLLDVWMDQLDICAELLAELEALEDEYRLLAEAALDAAEAAAELKVTDFSTADQRNYEQTKETTKSTSPSTPKNGDNGGSKPKEKEKEPEKHGTKMGYLDGWVVTKNGKTIGYYVESDDQKAVNSVKRSMGGSFFESYAAMEAAIDNHNKNAKPNEKTVKHPNRFKYSYSFDTGGYTGEWGSNGRLAVLHQKELVLNARDTENFLKAVDVMRTLQTNIDNIQSYARSIGNPNVNVTAPSADLNQNVHIDASFPNVSNSKEIEDAFNNLVNLASQRAMSTRR